MMVKFSAEEGKKRTGKRRCLPSSSCPLSDSGEEDGDAGDAGEADAATTGDWESSEHSSGGGNGSSDGGKESVTVTIDLDVLECPICYEIMDPPIFQCQNGHITCSSCCAKMNRCHSCLLPLGQTRCLALEKVVESIKVPCPYAGNGCGEIVGYAQRDAHKAACSHAPCHCPIAGCAFTGSVPQLARHFRSLHAHCGSSLPYNRSLKLSLDDREPFHVLVGADGILFLLLNNSSAPVGNAVSMVCIGPSSLKGRFSYQLKAKSGESCVQFESAVAAVRRRNQPLLPPDFLLLPLGFCGDQGRLSLDVSVWAKVP